MALMIADSSLFEGALHDEPPGLRLMVQDLQRRRQLVAPPAVFTQLLSTDRPHKQAQLLREWCAQLPVLAWDPQLWCAAGDLRAHLGLLAQPIDLVDALVLVLCAREAAQLWSLRPELIALAGQLRLPCYSAPGLRADRATI